MSGIEFHKVVDVSKYGNSLEEGADEFWSALKEAEDEIAFYDWCTDILERYVGMFYAGIVGVFLFRNNPVRSEIEEWVWVIVGDLPPIYITVENSPNAACALDAYIGAMEEWVEAAQRGESVADLVPVNVPANQENAEQLKIRLTMLDENILSNYQEDLKA